MDAMCGIYNSSLKDNNRYDSRDSVKIKPTEFIQLVWDIDFYNYTKERMMESFSNKDLHIKKLFIDLTNHLDPRNIGADSAKDVLSGAGILKDDNVSMTFFDIDGYHAANAFIFRNPKNRVTLYFPQSEFKFISFRSDAEMRKWVTNACATEEHRDMIASHFTIANRQDGLFYYGVDAWLASIDQDNDYYEKIAIKPKPAPSEHFFEVMHHSIKDKMLSDLDSQIKSDAEIKRDLWEDFIEASNIIPNPVSPFLALAIHLENAIDADTYAERLREWDKIKYDTVNIVTMVVMDKAIKLTNTNGYKFIEEVRSGINNFDHENILTTSGSETEYSADNNGAEEELVYDKERDCYRVKRGANPGKLCSSGNESPDPIVMQRERVSNECDRIIEQWHQPEDDPDGEERKLTNIATKNIEANEKLLDDPIDNGMLDDFISAGSSEINNYLRYGQDTSKGRYARKSMKLKKYTKGWKNTRIFLTELLLYHAKE